MKIDYRPVDDHILVEPFEADEKMPGGIVLPDNSRETPSRGTVLAVGKGRLLDSGQRAAIDVSVGDEVLYRTYSGTGVVAGDAKCVVVIEDDILVVVKRSEQNGQG